MENVLPVYRCPALTVLVDDSRSFLDSLVFQLGPQLECRAFQDAEAALPWIRHAFRRAAQQNEPIRVGFDEESDLLERRNVSIYLDRIYSIVTDRQRFSLPAAVVVDYAMPHMNGVEFCEAIKDLPCKKILLTGQADEKIAIQAFNRKLIDRYIKKNDLEALGHLGAEIAVLQKEFFSAQTSTLKDLLARHSYAFLSDPVMAALVEQLATRYRFVEYYLFPHPQGVLFFDAGGHGTLMVIETASSLTTHMEVAQDQGAPQPLIDGLREMHLVPFFSDTGGMYVKEVGQNWLQYCLPPHVCHGRENYYWALFDLPAHYLSGPVYSYAEHLKDATGGLAGAHLPG